MAESPTISRQLSGYPASLTFSRLREVGIEHIGELAGSIWTDYNLHDPGITTLELLCYAITDLVYRTNLSTADLLTSPPDQTVENNFFTAAEILSCNPLTELDYRKLLIDIDGVRNAWLTKTTQTEVPVYIDLNENQGKLTISPEGGEQELCFNGLYEVRLELEQRILTGADVCEIDSISSQRVLESVNKKLHAHRNLGEDFTNISVLKDEKIQICTDIELTPEAVLDDTLLKIYETIQEFLSPSIRFYSLQELLERGRTIEEIFEGRPLLRNEEDLIESNGFIDVEELKALVQREFLYSSDFYRILLDLEGVKAIRSFSLFSNLDPNGAEWCLKLGSTDQFRPVFDPEGSLFQFQKEGLSLKANKNRAIARFRKRLANVSKNKLDQNQLDTFVPRGQFRRDLSEYESIQNEFPLTYRIGPDELSENVTAKRKAEVLQFKAYLTFYDQVLANYLAQLSKLRDLFSLRNREGEAVGTTKSYFTQRLFQPIAPNRNSSLNGNGTPTNDSIPATDPLIEQIILNYNESGLGADENGQPLSYGEFLDFIGESGEVFNERRNKFLDHLLARFSEDFTDYVLLTFALNREENDLNAESIIKDKFDFLNQYPRISRDRGKGIDYRFPNAVWNTDEVSGLELRVGRLMGLDNVSRRSLSNFDIVNAGPSYQYRFFGRDKVLLLIGEQEVDSKQEAELAFDTLLRSAQEEDSYQKNDKDLIYQFHLLNEHKQVIATSTTYSFIQHRDHAFELLLRKNQEGSTIISITRKNGQWFLEWKDEKGTTLLTSVQGFGNESEAQEAIPAFQKFTKRRAFYRNKNQGLFGFQIIDDGGEILARHPEAYSTAYLRDAFIRLTKLHFQDGYPLEGKLGEVFMEGGGFTFSLQNDEGDDLLLAERVYEKEAEAWEILFLALKWSINPENYLCVDDNELSQYTFYLLDPHFFPDEIIVAKYPNSFSTEKERDDKLQELIDYFSSKDLSFYLNADVPTYTLALEDKDGQEVIRSKYEEEEKLRFGSIELAQAFLAEWLHIASQPNQYKKVQKNRSFHFELLHPNGLGIGESVKGYENEQTCQEEIERIAAYVKNDLLPVLEDHNLSKFIASDSSRWFFRFNVPANTPDLVGELKANDSLQACVSLYRIIELASDTNNYSVELEDACLYRIVLIDKANEGMVLASSTSIFVERAAAQQAISSLAQYIDRHRVRFRAPNEQEKQFRFRLLDGKLNPLFVSEEMYETEEEAQSAFDKFYDEIESEEANENKGNCEFSSLDNYRSEIACRPVIKYEERGAGWRFRVLASTQDPCEPTEEVKLEDALLVSQSYDTEEEAKMELERFLSQDQFYQIVREDAAKCKYRFFTYTNEQGLALPSFVLDRFPTSFELPTLREAKIDELVAAFSLIEEVVEVQISYVPPQPEELETDAVIFTPELKFPVGKGHSEGTGGVKHLITFTGTANYSSEHEAQIAAFDFLFYLRDVSNVIITETHQSEQNQDPEQASQKTYVILLCNDVQMIIAKSDSIPLTSDIEEFRSLVVDYATTYPIIRVRNHYRLRIRDREGNMLWRSNRQYATPASAFIVYKDILSIGTNKQSYFREDDPESCRFAFSLVKDRTWEHDQAFREGEETDRTIIANQPGCFELIEEVLEKIELVRNQINDEGFHLVEHILLRPKQTMESLQYRPQFVYIESDSFEQKHKMICEQSFKDKEKALKVLTAFIERAKDDVNLDKLKERKCYYILASGITVEGNTYSFISNTAYDVEAGEFNIVSAKQEVVKKALSTSGEFIGNQSLIIHPHFGSEQADQMPSLFPICIDNPPRDAKNRICDPSDDPLTKQELYDRYIPLGDPYSYWVTVVLPYWPKRFRNLEFRTFLERTLRREAPAHVAVRVVWVGYDTLQQFEKKYRQWLFELSIGEGASGGDQANNKLVEQLINMINFYEKGQLGPSSDSTSSFTINQSSLS